MRRSGLLILVAAAVIVGVTGSAYAPTPPSLELVPYNGGFFSINIPSGWQIITAGQCSTFAFVVRDPKNPLRQLFFFGEVGPVYLSEQQRQIDYQYMAMGGYPVSWIDTPCVVPLTPANFLANFSAIAASKTAQQFMPQCPGLENFQTISEAPQPSPIAGGHTALVRGLFTRNGMVGQGQFMATVAPLLGMTGGPSAGIGFGFLIAGVTAPKHEFAALLPVLSASLRSYSIPRSYVDNCLRMQARAYAGIQKAGQTLRESSDILMKGWTERNKTYDIIAEKRSDAMLGKERVYNPDTGEVYEFENGFYDKYNLDRQRYEMSNLQLLPGDNYDLWMKAAKDGQQHLH